MVNFDTEEFNDILEKCRDQSLQKEQDAVSAVGVLEWIC